MITNLRPSSADIWSACPAQPMMAERLAPQQMPSEPAMEGTCAAWLAEMVLTGQAEKCRDLVGEIHPENKWPVDYIMANHIQGYVDMIKERGGEIHAERQVKLNDHIMGTPDAYTVLQEKDGGFILHVDDLKYGYEIVTPYSKQVLIYAGAIYREILAKGYNITSIVIGIYQPRAFHVDGVYRTRSLSIEHFNEEVTRLERNALRCFDPDTFTSPGRQCKYCPVAGVCAALATELYDINAMMLGKANHPMTAEELANELRFLSLASDMMKGRKNAVEAEINARFDAGKNVPGWGRQSGYGHRKWKAEKGTIEFMTGFDATSDKLKTPSQLEKDGADPKIIKHLTETPRTKARLMEITPEDIARKFGEA